MNTRTLALHALALWAATIIVTAIYFIRGQTTPSADGRRAVLLAPAERDLVLTEMRGLLGAVQGIIAGVTRNDMAQVATAARAGGMAAAADVSPQLMAKLPLDFKRLGLSVHKGLDGLADAAKAGAGKEDVLKLLETQLTTCVGCHAAYRLPADAMQQR